MSGQGGGSQNQMMGGMGSGLQTGQFGGPLQAMAANPSMFYQQSGDPNGNKLTDPAQTMGGQGLLGAAPPPMPGANNAAPIGNPMLPPASPNMQNDPTINNAPPPLDPRFAAGNRPAWINQQMWASMGGQ